MKKFIGILFIIILLGVGATAFYLKTNYDKALTTPNSDITETIEFEVQTGESMDSITTRLIEAGLLKAEYKNYFLYYVRTNELYPLFQAGTFYIPQNLTLTEIATTLQTAGLPEVWITIQEGLRKDEIADILAESFSAYPEAIFNKDEFIALTTDVNYISTLGLNIPNNADLEGFIFPDRYLFPVDISTQEVMDYMIQNFKNRVGADYTYEDIIMGSILEREGRTSEERRMIADILYRRLDEGWYLGLCSTVSYVYKDWTTEITYDKIANESIYNTYNHLGLPPTPICNPGLASIQDAQNPTSNEYYFFLHEDNGTIHYAVTEYEHEVNKETYLVSN